MTETPMPFYAWKNLEVKKDTAENGGTLFFRGREWYHDKYGKYCEAVRRKQMSSANIQENENEPG